MTCSKCKLVRPNGDFRKGRECRSCRADYMRKWYRANAERLNAERRARGRDPKKMFEKTMARYGLAPADYHLMLAAQGGSCAICGIDKCQTGKRFAVDHDHTTGKVRGLLCNNCNRALGMFCDDPDLLEKAAAYLRERDEEAVA